MTMNLGANSNTEWAAIFLDELVLAGLRAVCFAPGSRSTPLVLAAEANSAVDLYRHLDERSAGYFALGLARSSGLPVALICTSGTAVANFFPAVVEAYESRIPLIVLTGDRPPELRGSGANQTIDQLKLFGDFVRQFVEMPVPQSDASMLVRRHLRTVAARVFASASGPPSGPVHVNFPFRKPLEPAVTPSNDHAPSRVASSLLPNSAYAQLMRGELVPTSTQIEQLIAVVTSHPNGLIVCGPNCASATFPAEVAALSRATGYPIVADPLSGLRHGAHVLSTTVLGGYDLLLQAAPTSWQPADIIIRFGNVPTSAALNAYIERSAPAHYYHISGDGVWADDLHLVRHFWEVDETRLSHELTDKLRALSYEPPSSSWKSDLLELERLTWSTLDDFLTQADLYDGSAVSSVLSSLSDDSAVLAGNSLPIRHVDLYDRPSDSQMVVYGNRGASGIDGNVSTAIGLAAGRQLPVVALLGDITFYHDMNGLMALGQPGVPPVIFVVLNNDGGGIFRRLPIAAAEPPFTELFLTPHGLTFEHVAAMYGLAYHRVIDTPDLADALKQSGYQAMMSNQSTLVEIVTDGATDLQMHKVLLNQVALVVSQRDGGKPTSNTIYTSPMLEPETVGHNKGENQ